MGALPTAIAKSEELSGCEVIMPLYKSTRENYGDLLEKVCDISFYLGWRKTGASIFKIKKNNVDYLFVENHVYFDREMLYGEFDDGERFAFFSTAVIEYIIFSESAPDVLHANDWQTALTVIYLKTKYKSNEKLSNIKTVYTIHNIEYQGKYDLTILGDIFALDDEYLEVVEYDGCINLTKGAIICADRISTVSPNYANELKYDFFSYGLADIVVKSENKLKGVLNGIDYSLFSPEADADIYFPYTRRGVKSGKAKNKKALQRELGLSENSATPLAIMICRLADGKGIDLVLCIIEELLAENLQFVILGVGEEKYESAFLNLEKKHKNFKALIRFDRKLSKKLYAAADIFLMPSKSEPCGLAQMIACSYGTIPIVRAVGGLYDTIRPYGSENANGFVFKSYNAHELLYTVREALNIYCDSEKWLSLVKSAIKSDFSWNNSALEYVEIYNELMIGKNKE